MTPTESKSRLGFSPRRWPISWRLAGVSAALTFVILVVFAVVVGKLATDRLRSNFESELHSTADEIAGETRIEVDALGQPFLRVPRAQGSLITGGANIAFVDATGQPVAPRAMSEDLPALGPPQVGVIRHVGSLDVVAAQVSTPLSVGQVYIEYASSTESLNETIDRLWLFLALGVVGGTVLATLAGLAVARRAMRPIADLTSTAREIAETRDPSQRVPQPESDDEIAELAGTLDNMLRELDAARTETEQMMHTQREFIADASHELRTPLTSILANLELLQEQLEREPTAGEEGEIVASALRSSRRMRRLVADLLLLARADAGRSGAHTKVDLAGIAAAAVDEVRPVADGHTLALRAGQPVEIEGNADELHRLVLNLLDNGLRYTPAGSEIGVAVERRNGAAILEVADDGPGLPAGVQAHLFDRFVRGEGPADVSADSGAGLGLAIVKAVASSHGGDVEAGSSQAGGARFTVKLPLKTGQHA
jgi:signal transduction histidine kinase